MESVTKGTKNTTPKADKAAKVSVPEAHVFMYLGPSIRGVITNGSIIRGTKAEIAKRFENEIKKYPQIERLITADRDVAKTRELLRNGEGGVSVAYNALESKITGKEG